MHGLHGLHRFCGEVKYKQQRKLNSGNISPSRELGSIMGLKVRKMLDLHIYIYMSLCKNDKHFLFTITIVFILEILNKYPGLEFKLKLPPGRSFLQTEPVLLS